MKLSSEVPAPYKGTRLLDYLTRRFSYLDAATWLERIAEGRLTHNGAPADPNAIVQQGDVVTYDVPPFPQPPANFDYTIVYADAWLLGINKPPGLRVHGEGRYMMANLIHHLRHNHTPPYPNATLCNRLDADTSGVVLAARDGETLRAMNQLLAERRIAKTYLALVHGVPDPAVGTIDQPVGKVENLRYAKRGRVPRCWVDSPRGKPAQTDYRVLEIFTLPENRRAALVELTPHTGRTHQLRVHMAWLGCPVVGDRLYMLNDEAYVAWRQDKTNPTFADWLPRQALHCLANEFVHPRTGSPVRLEAPLAADIQALVDTWRGEAAG